MANRFNVTRRNRNFHLGFISASIAVCSVFYYTPVIAEFAGWTFPTHGPGGFHDFYGLVFFAPVGYAAYIFGVTGAVFTALLSGLILLPYAIFVGPYPAAVFVPASFAVILSAVGSAIAMLQKADEQRRRSTNELKCLYDVGKAAEGTNSIKAFLSSVLEIIPQDILFPEGMRIRMKVRGKTYQSPDFQETSGMVEEEVLVSGEVLGNVEISCARRCPSAKKRYPFFRHQCHFVKTLAERISGAVRRIELEQSLKRYSQGLEKMVKERTKDLEQAQDKIVRSERLAAVGELASGVGHELRNPLNVIRNCVYLLNMTLADSSDDDTLTTLKLLDQQVDIGNKIVTDLLDFTRVRQPSLATVNLNGLVKQSLSWVAVPDDISVSAEFDNGSPQVNADAEQVGRAFANIISNAIQSMSGDGKLNISTDVGDGHAWVRFTDTGCGIPKENLDRIFEPLFTTKSKGIGLGLAITGRLIEQNGGTMEVASEVEKGTTFSIGLPLATAGVS